MLVTILDSSPASIFTNKKKGKVPVVPVQYLCMEHNLVYNFIFVVLMPGNTCALIPKIPEAS
jgi:hypothetical protein